MFGSTSTPVQKPLFGGTSATSGGKFGNTGGFDSVKPTTSIFGSVGITWIIYPFIKIAVFILDECIWSNNWINKHV